MMDHAQNGPCKKGKQELLKEQIDNHPLLQLPAQERSGATSLRFDLIDKLLAYFGFDRQLGSSSDDQCSILVQQEKKLQNHSKQVFDSLLFMEALRDALRYYQPHKAPGGFTPYFKVIYNQRMGTALSTDGFCMGSLPAPNLEQAREIKKLQDALEQIGCTDLANVPPRLIEDYAKQINMKPEKLRSIVNELNRTHQSLDQELDQGENDNAAMKLEIADLNASQAMCYLDNLDCLITLLLDEDLKVYPRLFLTNTFLRPLKEEPGDEAYLQALCHYEPRLWQQVFILAYLEFVFAQPPAPDSIHNICLARYQDDRRLNEVTISKYQKVSKARVSQHKKDFKKLLQKSKLLYDLWAEL